jgi:hypothetical protein
LIASANVAGRALARDLDLHNVNTFAPSLALDRAERIVRYLRPHLPATITIDSLVSLDRWSYIDSKLRASKGAWEKKVRNAVAELSGIPFYKRRIKVDGDTYEIDAAAPRRGKIQIALDVKRIESTRDHHKRTEEILNKAARVHQHNADALFGAAIYFPFEHAEAEVISRLRSPFVTCVVFAGEDDASILSAADQIVKSMIPADRSWISDPSLFDTK